MKHRIIFVSVIFGLIGFIMLLAIFDVTDFRKRYHQHVEASTVKSTLASSPDLKTHLPVIKLDTAGQRVPGTRILGQKEYELSEDEKKDIEARFELHEQGESPVTANARIHYRGNSSRYFRKKSYALQFIDPDKEDQDISLLGMSADNSWVLHGPYLDRSLIRNYMVMNLTGEIMPYAPNVRFVEMYVNDSYEGLYLLMEKISRGDGRIPLNPPSNNSIHTSYIVEIDRLYRMESHLNNFLTYTYRSYPSGTELKYPTGLTYTKEREEFVNDDLSYIAHSIYQIPFAQKADSYRNLIDVEAFYDYFIINELFRNVDAGHYSTYFFRDLKGKLTPVVWDFNNSLNNYQETTFDESGFSLTQSIFYEQLLKDESFTDGLIRRYFKLRESKLSTKRMHRYIDDTIDYLGDSIVRNNERWSDMYDLSQYEPENYLHRVDRNVANYEEAVGQLKGYLEKRGEWLDNHIETIRQYSHPSRTSHESIK